MAMHNGVEDCHRRLMKARGETVDPIAKALSEIWVVARSSRLAWMHPVRFSMYVILYLLPLRNWSATQCDFGDRKPEAFQLFVHGV